MITTDWNGGAKVEESIAEDIKKIADIKVRLTPWNTAMQVALGQEYLATHRKFITPSSANLFTELHLHSVVIEGKKYNVVSVKALSKFTSVTIKAVK